VFYSIHVFSSSVHDTQNFELSFDFLKRTLFRQAGRLNCETASEQKSVVCCETLFRKPLEHGVAQCVLISPRHRQLVILSSYAMDINVEASLNPSIREGRPTGLSSTST